MAKKPSSGSKQVSAARRDAAKKTETSAARERAALPNKAADSAPASSPASPRQSESRVTKGAKPKASPTPEGGGKSGQQKAAQASGPSVEAKTSVPKTPPRSNRPVASESAPPSGPSATSATSAASPKAPTPEVATTGTRTSVLPATDRDRKPDDKGAEEPRRNAVTDTTAVEGDSAPTLVTTEEPAPTTLQELVAATKPAPEPASEPEPEHHLEPAPWSEPPPAPARPSLFIVHITPELATVAKVGGLADVVFGLSRELAIRGNHVEIILPKYASMRYDQIHDLQEVYKDLWVPWHDGAIHCTVFFGFVHDRKCFFIEPHSQDNFFNRGSIYGFKDDALRYAFFSRAAMEFLWKSGRHPDVIHCHDWQTALAPVFLYELYQPLGMNHPRICLTIHNFAHQGVTGAELLTATGLQRPEHFLDLTRMGDSRYPKALNLLKGGIVYSNFVTTVSPRYAFETKDQGQGFGLESTLHTHYIKYGGVVNGIDYDVWNPEVDRQIPVRYGIDSIEHKYDNKRALRHRLMLADNEKPIVAFIGRLDPQKGLDLVRHAIFYTLERGAQFVLLGSSPDDRINGDFWGLKQMLNDSPDCHLEIGFDEDLSHLIYAGADLMLVPSRFEPCGLTQLISLRYGTIPVVRAVGGLADTVFDKDHSGRPLHERNGYIFRNYDNPGLESALGRAIACYRNHPDHFRELMKNAMRTDYSWNTPGQDYLNIYDYVRNA